MKISGHTLGTPDLDLQDALRLFRHLGMDGAEVIWQDGYRSGLAETDRGPEFDRARRLGLELGLEFAALTPYMAELNSLDDAKRDADVERFSTCISAAERLSCPRIRVYAGRYFQADADRRDVMWQRLVESLRHLGGIAADCGVTLCVENHFGTMTVTAAESVDLMLAVESPGVGILYDQANLAFTYAEPYQQAIDNQRRWIRHVHVKDLIFTDPGKPFEATDVARVLPEQRHVRSRVVGQGVLDWPVILEALAGIGYDGYLSLEYEYRWHPQDLPEPAEGFRESVDYLRGVLMRSGAGSAR